MIDPRAVATLGIGYGPRMAASVGLWPGAAPRPSPTTAQGGGSYRRGRRRPEAPAELDDDEVLILLL